nr:uncharacterized protein LOC113800380 [Penaeus vannamei]
MVLDSSSDESKDLEIIAVSPQKKRDFVEENEVNNSSSDSEEETEEREIEREDKSSVLTAAWKEEFQETIESSKVPEFTKVSPVISPEPPKKTEELKENGVGGDSRKPSDEKQEGKEAKDNKDDPEEDREEKTEADKAPGIDLVSPPTKTEDDLFVTLKINAKIPFLLVPLDPQGKSIDTKILKQFLTTEQVPFVSSGSLEQAEQTGVRMENSEQLPKSDNDFEEENQTGRSDVGNPIVTSTPVKKTEMVESPVEKSIKENGEESGRRDLSEFYGGGSPGGGDPEGGTDSDAEEAETRRRESEGGRGGRREGV